MVNEHGESTVICAPENFEAVQQALADAGLVALHAGVGMRPNNRVAVPEDVLEPLTDLLERLDGLDDVSEVYHNALLPSDDLAPGRRCLRMPPAARVNPRSRP